AFYVASVLMLPNPDIPLNDDWMYARTVRYGIETGQLTTTGYQSPWGIPQFYLGVLLSSVAGFAHAHLRWLNVASVPILLLVLTLVLSRRGASFTGSVVLLASVAWFAPFFLTSFTFMTDLLFLLFWTATLFFWERAHSAAKRGAVYLGGA